MNKIILKLFFLIFASFLIQSCGTQVPTKTKVTKTENIIGEPKKVFLNEKSEKVDEKLFYKIYSENLNEIYYEFKVREYFKIPEALMREDIAREYITRKKQATMVHNPIGEGTGSIFALGLIEAWCLAEWTATVLPGKQKNIYLDKCKERYVGTKTKTTRDTKTEKMLGLTGNFKKRYQDRDNLEITYHFKDYESQKTNISYEIERVCDSDSYEVFNCGKRYLVDGREIIQNYLKIHGKKNLSYPIEFQVRANTHKVNIKLPTKQSKDLVKILFQEEEEKRLAKIKEEKERKERAKKLEEERKEKERIAKLEREEEEKRKQKELEERYKPVAAWNGTGFFVSAKGHIITNSHVVEDTSLETVDGKCDSIKAYLNDIIYETDILSQDRMNDLALLKIKKNQTIKNFASFRDDEPILGEDITTLGYPFGKTISSKIKLTSGVVSSLSGIGDEFTRMQIDAALQPGNSGGPIYDSYGNVIGVAVAKAGIFYFLENFGTLPENMNFGIKPSVVKTFLQSNGVKYKTSNKKVNITKVEIAKEGTKQTVYLECMIRKDKLAKINKETNERN